MEPSSGMSVHKLAALAGPKPGTECTITTGRASAASAAMQAWIAESAFLISFSRIAMAGRQLDNAGERTLHQVERWRDRDSIPLKRDSQDAEILNRAGPDDRFRRRVPRHGLSLAAPRLADLAAILGHHIGRAHGILDHGRNLFPTPTGSTLSSILSAVRTTGPSSKIPCRTVLTHFWSRQTPPRRMSPPPNQLQKEP